MNSYNITISKDFEEKCVALLDRQAEEYNSYRKQIDDAIENILRNHVTPPIKGEITKSKLKWRGITSTVFSNNGFVGILQRDILITINGYKIHKLKIQI